MRHSRFVFAVCGLLLAGCGTPQVPVDQVSQSSTDGTSATTIAAPSVAASPELVATEAITPPPATPIESAAPTATSAPQPTLQPKAVQPTVAPTTVPQVVQPAAPTPVPPAQGTITIDEPMDGATISSPLTVKGSTDFWPFEATLTGQIKDAAGNVIGIGPVMVDAPAIGQGGPFEAQIEWQQPAEAQAGTLEIFEASAKDGSIVVIATVPVQLSAAP